MYEAFFNLKNKPFSLLPDPEFLFLSSRHAIGLSLLEYSLTGQAGFCVITGEIGSGKTTLVRAFLGRVGREFSVGLIANTHHALKDIAAWALGAFGQKAAGTHPSETYQELMAYLIAEYGAGRQCILIVDEAQNLTIDVLEELRLLSNINSGKDLLLQVVLVGQPELLDKLKRPELSQFAQRIAISHHLTSLPFAETRRYIEHRVKIAGSDRPLFTEMAMGAIQYFSGGIPRLINSICDMALVYGFADEKQLIDEELVFRVVSDRQLSGIAPFAHSVPVDDPSVRAEIMKLTSLLGSSGQVAALAETSEVPAKQMTATKLDAVPEAEPAPEPSSVIELKATPERTETIAHKNSDLRRVEPTFVIPLSETAGVGMATNVPQRMAEPIKTAPTALASGGVAEAKVKKPSPANPYLFRDHDDDEELLLTIEMNDSLSNAHKLAPTQQRAASMNPSNASKESQPGAAWNSDRVAGAAGHSPNQTTSAEESPKPVVDTAPWPSINERRPGAPIPEKEHGTGTPPRRSWWRRSIARSS